MTSHPCHASLRILHLSTINSIGVFLRSFLQFTKPFQRGGIPPPQITCPLNGLKFQNLSHASFYTRNLILKMMIWLGGTKKEKQK